MFITNNRIREKLRVAVKVVKNHLESWSYRWYLLTLLLEGNARLEGVYFSVFGLFCVLPEFAKKTRERGFNQIMAYLSFFLF